MFSSQCAYVFPKLVRVAGKSANLINCSIPLYRLDWRDVDEAKAKEHQDWLKSLYVNEKDMVPFTPLLNQVWLRNLDNLEFAVTEEYGQEIQRYTSLGASEHSRKSSIKEPHLVTNIARIGTTAINAAFFLIADCIWDKDHWYRGEDKTELYKAMLVRFWDTQAPEDQILNITELENVSKGPFPECQQLLGDVRHQKSLRVKLEEPFRTCPQKSLTPNAVFHTHRRTHARGLPIITED